MLLGLAYVGRPCIRAIPRTARLPRVGGRLVAMGLYQIGTQLHTPIRGALRPHIRARLFGPSASISLSCEL
jgi:hypothetical protein